MTELFFLLGARVVCYRWYSLPGAQAEWKQQSLYLNVLLLFGGRWECSWACIPQFRNSRVCLPDFDGEREECIWSSLGCCVQKSHATPHKLTDFIEPSSDEWVTVFFTPPFIQWVRLWQGVDLLFNIWGDYFGIAATCLLKYCVLNEMFSFVLIGT